MRAWPLLCVLLAGCDAGARLNDPGLHLGLRVEGAQLLRGDLRPDRGGPPVAVFEKPQTRIRRGEADVTVSGRLGPGGVALHLQRVGDPDRWGIRATIFDQTAEDTLLWQAKLAFAPFLADDGVELRAQAIDARGRGGPISTATFEFLPEPPPSQLAFTLAWDRPADLDIHVVTPAGIDINPKNISEDTPPPPGQLGDPDAPTGGRLDIDSNVACRIDARQREQVLWTDSPPAPGTYRVYVDLFSACEQPVVSFRVTAHRGDALVEEGAGILYPFDQRRRPSDGEAPGLQVLELELD